MGLCDSSGYTICGIHTSKDVKYFQEEISIPLSGWRLTDTISTEFLYQDIYELRTFMFVVSLGLLMICLLATFFAIYSQLRPLFKLKEQMQQVMAGNLNAEIATTDSKDEISSLSRTFNNMVTEIGHLIEEIQVTQKRESELRFEMLLAQINPHFLFNTLNMIASTAQIEDAAATEKMITALSRLFRYNLKSAGTVMPLERELKIIQDYMYLQKMRFGQRVRYDTDCAPETLDVLVPSFVLQPLVENSIKHGLSKESKGGRIFIRTWMRGERLWISVSDTGVGMEEERLQQIRAALNDGTENEIGIGVGNIYRRVHGLYEDGEMFIYSKKGCGTAVQLAFTPKDIV